MTDKNVWGYHAHIDARSCNIESITSEENIKNFTKELIERIDMVAFGDIYLQNFALHDVEKAGYSMFQMIETSNISAHFVSKNGNAYFDIFSCKPFSEEIVVKTVMEFFKPTHIKSTIMLRDCDSDKDFCECLYNEQ